MGAIPESERLTDAERAEIRRLYATGRYGADTLAARFGSTTTAVRRACRGIVRPRLSKGWRSVHADRHWSEHP